MRVVVFLGPTLRPDVAGEILPGAFFLPPAGQADILSALTTHQPDVVGLIDGVFGQAPSVWHKEILFALHRGVRVVGAASLGALRAAELDSFGMEGVGEIYRRFRSGELTDDDEVALLHADTDLAFRPLSEPMVNVRATLERACRDHVVTDGQERAVLESAKRLHFPDRTLHHIIAGADLSADVAETLSSYFRSHYVDLKASDARLLLETIRDAPSERRPVEMVHSRGFDRLYNEERRARHLDAELPLRDIAAYAALALPDFDHLNFNALNRALVLVLAQLLDVDVTPDELEAEAARFRRERGLGDATSVQAWRQRHHLDEAELDALVHDVAVCRRLHRWLSGSQHFEGQTRWLLDELRLRDRYVGVADRAARQHAPPGDVGSLGELQPQELLDLVNDHRRATGWHPVTPLAEWAEEAGFSGVKDLAYALLRLRRSREQRGPPLVHERDELIE